MEVNSHNLFCVYAWRNKLETYLFKDFLSPSRKIPRY